MFVFISSMGDFVYTQNDDESEFELGTWRIPGAVIYFRSSLHGTTECECKFRAGAEKVKDSLCYV